MRKSHSVTPPPFFDQYHHGNENENENENMSLPTGNTRNHPVSLSDDEPNSNLSPKSTSSFSLLKKPFVSLKQFFSPSYVPETIKSYTSLPSQQYLSPISATSISSSTSPVPPQAPPPSHSLLQVPSSSPFKKSPHVSTYRHILRTFWIFLILNVVAFCMGLMLVYLDNRSLKYLYGVTNREEWNKFSETIDILDKQYPLELKKRFPAILLKPEFGGKGYLAGNYTNLFYSYHSITLYDLVLNGIPRDFYMMKFFADLFLKLFLFMTFIYLISMPYFEVFKTKIKRTFLKTNQVSFSTKNPMVEYSKNIDGEKENYPLNSLPNSSANARTNNNNNNNNNRHHHHHHHHNVTIIDDREEKEDFEKDIFIEKNFNNNNNSVLPERPQSAPLPVNSGDPEDDGIKKITQSQSSFFFPKRYIHALVFIRRFFIISAITFAIRWCILALTVLPPINMECIPHYRHSFGEVIYSAFLIYLGQEIACHDFLFSGHTSLAVISYWFWTVYASHVLFHPKQSIISVLFPTTTTPAPTTTATSASSSTTSSVLSSPSIDQYQQHPSKSLEGFSVKKKKSFYKSRTTAYYIMIWLIRFIGICVLSFIVVAITTSGMHYSVDCLLALFIGSMSFWIWHTLLTINYYFKFKSSILEVDTIHSANPSVLLSPGTTLANLALSERQIIAENREVRDIIVPIKKGNILTRLVGWVDGYDLYVKDNIGYFGPDSIFSPGDHRSDEDNHNKDYNYD